MRSVAFQFSTARMVDSTQRNFSNVTSTMPPTTQYEGGDLDSITLKWLRIVFYGVICIVGTVGNALVILAYRNPRMRSVTNLFIANLGVADLTVTLINVPFTVSYSTLWLLAVWCFSLQGNPFHTRHHDFLLRRDANSDRSGPLQSDSSSTAS